MLLLKHPRVLLYSQDCRSIITESVQQALNIVVFPGEQSCHSAGTTASAATCRK